MNRILTISITLFLIGHLVTKWYVADLDFFNLTVAESEILWLIQLIRDIGFWSFSSLIVVFSIFNFKTNKNTKKATLYIALSVGLNLCYAVSLGYAYFKTDQIASTVNLLQKHEPDLLSNYQSFLDSNDKSISELIEATNLIASSVYTDNGIIVKVITEDGLQTNFVPSQDLIKSRKDLLHANALIIHTAKSFKYASITSLCILIISLFLGLFSVQLYCAYNKLLKRT